MSYKIGRVYRIICLPEPNIQYVGSTFDTLRNRWQNHKRSINSKGKTCSITKYFKEYGIENFKIVLIKEYQIVDKKHLESKEQLWVNKINCINEKNTMYFKYLSQKQWGIINKDRLKIKRQEYYKQNKQKFIKKRLPSLSIECECGGKYKIQHKAVHMKTNRHIQFKK